MTGTADIHTASTRPFSGTIPSCHGLVGFP